MRDRPFLLLSWGRGAPYGRAMHDTLPFAVRFRLAALPMLCALALLAVGIAPARAAPFAVNMVVDLDEPLNYGDYFWDEEGVPQGRIRIVVDLARDLLYVYRGGGELARAKIIQGDVDKPTPTGSFPILEKDADHYSNLYGGAPMPYMLRLTWDGIAIHGSDVAEENATHGCIGLPEEFAALLFRAVRKGDPVLVTRHWMLADYRH